MTQSVLPATAPSEGPSSRRHDLDALRASAMLLGIAFHVALSFAQGFPWLVQDSRRNEGFLLFEYASHGFRMPLFFLISGFFTAMLWRKRGLKALLEHRFRRILLPCLLGLVTIVPATFVAAGLALQSGSQPTAAPPTSASRTTLFDAVVADDTDGIRRCLEAGQDVNARHPAWGTPPLVLAALIDRREAVALLLAEGAEVNGSSQDGGTALHAAAFLGHDEMVRLLIEHGADVQTQNQRRETPADVATTDWAMTQIIAAMLQIPVEEERVREGRERALEHLRAAGAEAPPAGANATEVSPWLGAVLTGLLYVPVWHHLWFLWFLWWLVLGFSLCFLIAGRMGWRGAPGWLVLSPVRLLWLVPLTMLPQAVMGATSGGFGPDTSVGLLPMPHVFLYYAIFFGFGILYYEADDATGRLGKGWRWSLPVTLLVVFPLGLELCTGTFGFRDKLPLEELHRPLAVGLQALYVWLMTFGCMGLFRSLLKRENRTVRWLSDSSYWLYLAHLPLVILGQLWVRDWPVPSALKFVLLNVLVLGFLLVTYQWLVRYRWLGKLLNGPRTRPARSPAGLTTVEPASQ